MHMFCMISACGKQALVIIESTQNTLPTCSWVLVRVRLCHVYGQRYVLCIVTVPELVCVRMLNKLRS